MSAEDSSPQAAPGHVLAGVGTGGNNGTLEGVFTAPVAQSATLQGLRTRKNRVWWRTPSIPALQSQADLSEFSAQPGHPRGPTTTILHGEEIGAMPMLGESVGCPNRFCQAELGLCF